MISTLLVSRFGTQHFEEKQELIVISLRFANLTEICRFIFIFAKMPFSRIR